MSFSVTFLDAETAKVVWDRPDPIEITYTRLSETTRADAINAVIEVSTEVAHIGWVAGPQRVNLLSSSALDSLRRMCQNRTDIPDWQMVLGRSTKAVIEGYLGQLPATDIDLDAVSEPPAWLLRPLLEAEGYTVVYARGGSGKSYLAAATAVSVATGEPLLGTAPAVCGPVAYLDWESTAATLNHRISRLCAGAGIGTLAHRIRHYSMSGPFAARRSQMSPALASLGPALIIIDSKGLATTGAPESAEGILDLARSLRYMPAPVMLIDHVSKGAIKGDDPDMAFGSQYVEASARLAWSLRTEAMAGQMRITLRNTKANNHARSPDLRVELVFAGDSVAILTDESPHDETAALGPKATAIFDWLSERGPARLADIAAGTDINKGTVHRVLNNTPGFRSTDDLWEIFAPPAEIPF